MLQNFVFKINMPITQSNYVPILKTVSFIIFSKSLISFLVFIVGDK